MPLNDHPSAKPTLRLLRHRPFGKTAIANGELVSQQANHGPDANFPGGSTTLALALARRDRRRTSSRTASARST